MADPVTKKAFVLRDFGDAGTEKNFPASIPGKTDTMPDIEEGAFANYAAAGLVREATADDQKAVVKSAA